MNRWLWGGLLKKLHIFLKLLKLKLIHQEIN